MKKAEAEAEAKYLGGVEVARQRQATDGLRENILNFSTRVEGTSAKEVMDLIMVTQYFDTIRDIGNLSRTPPFSYPMAQVTSGTSVTRFAMVLWRLPVQILSMWISLALPDAPLVNCVDSGLCAKLSLHPAGFAYERIYSFERNRALWYK